MRNDDQWFEPGDKVVRVARNNPSGAGVEAVHDAHEGVVYCVEKVWKSYSGFSVMRLVGVPLDFNVLGDEYGFLCSNFRKVEEIQLCVRAAEAMKTPKKQEELV